MRITNQNIPTIIVPTLATSVATGDVIVRPSTAVAQTYAYAGHLAAVNSGDIGAINTSLLSDKKVIGVATNFILKVGATNAIELVPATANAVFQADLDASVTPESPFTYESIVEQGGKSVVLTGAKGLIKFTADFSGTLAGSAVLTGKGDVEKKAFSLIIRPTHTIFG